ncbi:MAG: RNA polymerase factor sigma-54 [Verrucomicrobia bacterium]|nr:RNA polymerase factor sigma-54 [Verrucomicrobiota bacterium]
MGPGLHLGQRMALTQVLAPQLQQSLALLQAPTLELKAMIEQEIQVNPILEEVQALEPLAEERATEAGDATAEAARSADPTEPPSDLNFDPATEKPTAEPVDDFQKEVDKLLQLDQEWRDHFSQSNVPSRVSQEDEERRQYMFDSLVATTSLQESLLEQVRTAELEEHDRKVAELIVGNIDDYGYLQSKVEELSLSTGIPPESILRALKVIQTFHPPGVGARDLRECLMLQLERAGKTDTVEYRILDKFMDALGRRRLPDIARGLDLDTLEVQDAVQRIALLEPRPGRDFLPDNDQYVVPEIFVQKNGEEYVVSSNNDHIPHLRISNHYKDLLTQPDSSGEVREYIREKIRAGKFFIKSLHQRQETILNIAREIVARQRDFMENGVAQLKPLTMVQVASVVGVHETTVSRAVSGKYMQTPQGVFEMKYFFTSGIQTADGVNMSNTSVKDKIAEMIKKENPSHPFSDEDIVKDLSEQGIKIARRTVAKYRSELNILPSHLRKVY